MFTSLFASLLSGFLPLIIQLIFSIFSGGTA